MTAFEFSLPTRLIFGANAVDRIGELARELGAARVFLVTDPGIVAAGHDQRVEAALKGSGIELRRFDAVHENPTTRDVDACVQALGTWDAEVVIGLGGGSGLDVAKGCCFLHAGGGSMEDYRGRGTAKGQLLPMIAIPTTAGTGSETQSFALIEQEGSHQKMACGDPQALPRIAVLDPTLTVTQPRFVTACTGLDALGHAVETAVTTARSPISTLFSAEAFALIHASLPRVLTAPNDLQARGQMLKAAAYAGIAIENSMLGAAHSMANPITAHYGLAHGEAVGMMLPIVVRHNAANDEAQAIYAGLSRANGLCGQAAEAEEAVEAFVARLEQLLDEAGIERSLGGRDVNVSLQVLASEAAGQWTARFNPRIVSEQDFRTLFAQAGVPMP